jgi:hyperosmotically inducible protein
MRKLILCSLVVTASSGAFSALAADLVPADAVVDSVITVKVKSKLAAKHMSTLTKIKVTTDKNGVVWLTGTAPTEDASAIASKVSQDTDGVISVHNRIVVQ